MNKEKQNIVPALRFPEFEKDDIWEIKSLSTIAKNLSNRRVPITSNVREKGEIPYYGATGVIDYVKDFIYNENLLLISEDGANLIDRNYPIAYSIFGKTWVNNHAHVLKPINEHIQILVEKYINSKSIEDYLTGQAQPKLNKANLNKIPIPIPKNPKEQQKIANCLSSLDNLITAETEKLAHLKDHKKGLLQQLFPAKGETKPQFRFPEFVDDGDWEEKELSFALDGKSSQISKNKLNFTEKGYPVYGADGMLGFIDSFVQKDDYIAIVKDGSGVGNLFFYKGKSSLLGTLNYLISKDNQEYKLKWLYYFLQKINFKSFVKGSTIPHIYYKDYSKLLVLIPSPKEQQKIANCLSSVDELIQSQTEKIATLKAHKKGLMQQLFPSLNGEL